MEIANSGIEGLRMNGTEVTRQAPSFWLRYDFGATNRGGKGAQRLEVGWLRRANEGRGRIENQTFFCYNPAACRPRRLIAMRSRTVDH
jgi:hypothetical protein